MTSIYKQEDKHYIYQSEKPFPEKESTTWYGLSDEKMSPYDHYLSAVKYWFKNAKRIVVKEGEEEKFKLFMYRNSDESKVYLIDQIDVKVNEGVEMPESCYRIDPMCCRGVGDYATCDRQCNKEPLIVAVFVDSVPHAKGKEPSDKDIEAYVNGSFKRTVHRFFNEKGLWPEFHKFIGYTPNSGK